MKFLLSALLLSIISLPAASLFADEARLQRQVMELSKRVEALEAEMAQLSNKDKWKDPVYWQGLKRDMSEVDVVRMLGKPARIEEQIFTTWYYHQTSKLHSFIWFDEGKVLGWELPQD